MFPSLPSRLAAAAVGARAAISAARLLRGALVAAVLAVSACNTNNVLSLRPDVDVGTQTAAVPRAAACRIWCPTTPICRQADRRRQQATCSAELPGRAAQPVDAAEPVEMARRQRWRSR